MIIGYINGEKVYVEEIDNFAPNRRPRWSPFDGTVQVITQKELIRVLTKIIEDADRFPVGDTAMGHHDDLARIIRETNFFSDEESHKFHIEYVDKKNLRFDIHTETGRPRRAKLPKAERRTVYEGPKVIPGGLLPAPSAKSKPGEEIVSATFKAWKAEQEDGPHDRP